MGYRAVNLVLVVLVTQVMWRMAHSPFEWIDVITWPLAMWTAGWGLWAITLGPAPRERNRA